jgi:Kef-type K+ transport system membrane component KefB
MPLEPTAEGRGKMHHFDAASFLAAAVGLLGLTALSLLVFKRIGVGSIAAFLIAGLAVRYAMSTPSGLPRSANSPKSA